MQRQAARSTHLLPSDFLELADEGEGQGDVERRAFVGRNGPLSRLERHHQVDPGGRPAGAEPRDELGAEYVTQQTLELHVHTWNGSPGAVVVCRGGDRWARHDGTVIQC